MNQLFEQLLETAKQDKVKFYKLKKCVVGLQQYELASKLRDLEKDMFPESEMSIKAQSRGIKLKFALKAAGINTDDGTAWLVSEIIKQFDEQNGSITTEEIRDLEFKKNDIFYKD